MYDKTLSIVSIILLLAMASVSAEESLLQQAPAIDLSDLAPPVEQPKPAPAPAAPRATAPAASSPVTSASGDVATEKIGAWEKVCTTASPVECLMIQTGDAPEGGTALMFQLRKFAQPEVVGEGQSFVAVADIIMPLGVVLIRGVGFEIDASGENRLPFQVCTAQGCVVQLPFNDQLVAAAKAGNTIKITMDSPKGPVPITISLSGFTKAFNSL